MSEAKFTKGEWFLDKDAECWIGDDNWGLSVKRDSDGSVHHCLATVVCKMEHEESNDELEASAYLITAAPEMYEELQEVSNWLNSQLGIVDWHKDIEKLLAKARGESC